LYSDHSDDALRSFLIGEDPVQPQTTPWLRTFLEASRIPDDNGWRHTGEPCWSCHRSDLTLGFNFRPVLTPSKASLCLRCGAVDAEFVYGMTRRQLRGDDWENVTGAVLALRQAVRARQALAEEAHEEDVDWDD
jgi:hypothetical protein